MELINQFKSAAKGLSILCSTVALMTVGSNTITLAFSAYSLTDLQISDATDINNNGQVLGNGSGPVLWENGHITHIIKVPFARGKSINDQSQVVGNVDLPTGLLRIFAFLWENERFTYFSPAVTNFGIFGIIPDTYSVANGINNRSQVVGVVETQSIGFPNVAVVWQSDGSVVELAKLPNQSNQYTEATAINDVGQIVGYSLGSTRRAVLWDNNQIINLGSLLSSASSYPTAINNQGQIVGYSSSSLTSFNNTRAVLWDNGQVIDLNTLGGTTSYAYDINDSGQIVGTSGDRAVIWENGKIADLNTLCDMCSGWTLSSARAINNVGQIVGSGRAPDGRFRSFLLTPISEEVSDGKGDEL